ncbi:MAG: peptidylprolyl isomerase [Planctomycetota bacterium]
MVLARPDETVTPPVATLVDARPAALVNGRSVTWGDLRPGLNEAAGGEILEETILDRQLRTALAEAGLVIGPEEAARERALLVASLDPDSDVALRLLDELRARQRLGETRFQGLLRRNAALRALVADEVEVNDEDLRVMHDRIYGPRRRCRLMLVPSLGAARDAIERVQAGESFAEVATTLSTDVSATRGGLLEPISANDPAYPESIRRALWALDGDGTVSAPVLLDRGYAVIQLVEEVPADPTPLADVSASLRDTVRRSRERVLMDQLARRLLREAQVTVFDDHLHESWRRRTGGR